jgi:protein-S-isoprenylcysteine O-methyltransferase Ste14
MSDTAHKSLALTLLLTAAIIGAVSLMAFFHFLYVGSLGWVNLGLNEAERLVFNTLLSFTFFLQHSGMIRRPFRQILGNFIPPHYHGATYTVASGLILLAVVLLWQSSDIILVEVDGPLAYVMRVFYFLSVLGIVWGLWALHSFDMFGLDPIRKKLQAKPSSSMPFTIRGPYRWVRHPLYLFMIVLIWSHPILTTDRMLFNIFWTLWIVVGTVFEERDLVDDFGDAYRDYQAKVPMLVPHGVFPAHPTSEQESSA